LAVEMYEFLQLFELTSIVEECSRVSQHYDEVSR